MQKMLLVAILMLCSTASVWGVNTHTETERSKTSIEQRNNYLDLGERKRLFRQNIPSIAKQFIGLPYKLGGNPQLSGMVDNSHLFFSVYTLAVQKTGLSYKAYMPMKSLLRNIREVDENDLQNGDLMVLNNAHTAMIYQIEKTGKIHLIYASQRKRQVISFNSDNLVFHVYWLENLKGFYRLSTDMLTMGTSFDDP